MELCGARWEGFDLNDAVCHLPAERVKNSNAIDITILVPALEWLKELNQMSCNSQWVHYTNSLCSFDKKIIVNNLVNHNR